MSITYPPGLAIPQVFVSDGFGGSFTQHYGIGPATGSVWLFTGVDVQGLVQPDNGSFQISYECAGCGTGYQTLLTWQQSANFPGPFNWRGMVPYYFGSNDILVTGTIGFDYKLWGLVIPDPRIAFQA